MKNKNPKKIMGFNLTEKQNQPSLYRALLEIFRLKESDLLLLPALYSSPELGLKACVTTAWHIWLTSVTVCTDIQSIFIY